MDHPENTVIVWTFCIILPRQKLFQSKEKAWGHVIQEISALEGLVGVTPIADRAVLVHMNTENDSIIAKNRLRYIGVAVSKETTQNVVDPKLFFPKEDT